MSRMVIPSVVSDPNGYFPRAKDTKTRLLADPRVVHWWESNTTTTTTSEGKIATWNDLKAGGAIVQASGISANRPALVANAAYGSSLTGAPYEAAAYTSGTDMRAGVVGGLDLTGTFAVGVFGRRMAAGTEEALFGQTVGTNAVQLKTTTSTLSQFFARGNGVSFPDTNNDAVPRLRMGAYSAAEGRVKGASNRNAPVTQVVSGAPSTAGSAATFFGHYALTAGRDWGGMYLLNVDPWASANADLLELIFQHLEGVAFAGARLAP